MTARLAASTYQGCSGEAQSNQYRLAAKGLEMTQLLNSPLVRSVLIRAARTFMQTFLAVMIAGPMLDLSVRTLRAAGLAGVTAVLSMLHRMLDETPVPSLPDVQPRRPDTPQPANDANDAMVAAGRR
jgi:Putative lactococcus lactis phage r1t holin